MSEFTVGKTIGTDYITIYRDGQYYSYSYTARGAQAIIDRAEKDDKAEEAAKRNLGL